MPGCGATALLGGTAIGASPALTRVGPVRLRPEGQRVQAFWPGGSKFARGPPVG